MWKRSVDLHAQSVIDDAVFEANLVIEIERIAQNVRVPEMAQRMSMKRKRIERVRKRGNATIPTLARMAHALGKRIKFVLVDEVEE